MATATIQATHEQPVRRQPNRAPDALNNIPLSPLGRAALALARQGNYVLPVRECDGETYWSKKDKKNVTPAAKSPYTRHGVYDGTTDEARIREYWSR